MISRLTLLKRKRSQFSYRSTPPHLSWQINLAFYEGVSDALDVAQGTYQFLAKFTSLAIDWGDGSATDIRSSDGITLETVTHVYTISNPTPLLITGDVSYIHCGTGSTCADKVIKLIRFDLPSYVGNGAVDPFRENAADGGEFAGCYNMTIAPNCKLSEGITSLVGTFKGCYGLGATAGNIRWPSKLISLYYTFENAFVNALYRTPLPNSVETIYNAFASCGTDETFTVTVADE